MIHSIEFTADWRCFKAGDHFDFHSGVNLLVGDQGRGKSSLLAALQAVGLKKTKKFPAKMECDPGPIYTFDFERDNPRLKGYIGGNAIFQIGSMFKSHGETNLKLIEAMQTASNCVVMLDEPDTALSIRSCKLPVKLIRGLVKRNSQAIITVHNVAVIQEFNGVLSLERGGWMPSEKFIRSHNE